MLKNYSPQESNNVMIIILVIKDYLKKALRYIHLETKINLLWCIYVLHNIGKRNMNTLINSMICDGIFISNY